MTNKYMYFIANWKMFGGLNTLNSFVCGSIKIEFKWILFLIHFIRNGQIANLV